MGDLMMQVERSTYKRRVAEVLREASVSIREESEADDIQYMEEKSKQLQLCLHVSVSHMFGQDHQLFLMFLVYLLLNHKRG